MVYNPRNLNLNGFSYNCPLNNCGRVFLSIFAYIDHLACPGHQHEELECPECDEEFEGLGYLTWHLFLKHMRPSRCLIVDFDEFYPCVGCAEVKRSRRHLEQHMRNKHKLRIKDSNADDMRQELINKLRGQTSSTAGAADSSISVGAGITVRAVASADSKASCAAADAGAQPSRVVCGDAARSQSTGAFSGTVNLTHYPVTADSDGQNEYGMTQYNSENMDLLSYVTSGPSFPVMESVTCSSSYGNKLLGSLTSLEQLGTISDLQMFLRDELGDFKTAGMSQTPSDELFPNMFQTPDSVPQIPSVYDGNFSDTHRSSVEASVGTSRSGHMQTRQAAKSIQSRMPMANKYHPFAGSYRVSSSLQTASNAPVRQFHHVFRPPGSSGARMSHMNHMKSYSRLATANPCLTALLTTRGGSNIIPSSAEINSSMSYTASGTGVVQSAPVFGRPIMSSAPMECGHMCTNCKHFDTPIMNRELTSLEMSPFQLYSQNTAFDHSLRSQIGNLIESEYFVNPTTSQLGNVGHSDSYFSRDDCPPEVPGTSRLGNNSSANNIEEGGQASCPTFLDQTYTAPE